MRCVSLTSIDHASAHNLATHLNHPPPTHATFQVFSSRPQQPTRGSRLFTAKHLLRPLPRRARKTKLRYRNHSSLTKLWRPIPRDRAGVRGRVARPQRASARTDGGGLTNQYDEVNNITEVKDWRLPSEWPTGAKPVNRTFEYDDLYRLTRVRYEHTGSSAGGSGTGQGDAWTSPFEAENTQADKGPKPSPHVDFTERVKEQRYAYDHLGNTTKTSDDQNGFFDRSLGNVSNGTPAAGPHQLTGASNRATSPSSTRKGDLLVSYDPAGNMERMIVKRDGACLPSGASCWQRFSYEWDELGRLAKAQRWDLAVGSERTNHAQLTTTNPTRAPDVELRYLYDSSGQRTVKTAVDPTDNQRHTVYVFPTLELRSAEWKTATNALAPDYELTKNTENVLLPGAGLRARVIYSETDLPSQSSGKQRLFLELGDHLGSTTVIIDHDTGELVEHSAYMAYGATDSDYRPDRWDNFREPYKFSGKEEDVEVGLVYFGARYLVPGLGRWASADPVTVHQFGADPNPYAYVAGRPLVSIDPNGNEPITLGVVLTAIAVGAVVGAVAGGVVNAGWQWYDKGKFSAIDWGAVGIAAGAGAIGGAVGGPIAGPLVGGWTGAIVGGAAGSGTGYLAHVGLSGSKFTWKGFGLSVAFGAVAGGLFYGATRLLAPRAGSSAAGAGKGKPAAAATPKAAPSTPAPAAPPANAATAADNVADDPIKLFKLPPAPKHTPRSPPVAGAPKTAPTPPRVNPADVPDNLCGEACWAARRAVRAGEARLPIGRRGNPISIRPGTNRPTMIGGRQFTGHALDRMQGRGIMPSVVDDTIKHGVGHSGRDGARIYTSSQLKVVLNPNGSVKTVIPR